MRISIDSGGDRLDVHAAVPRREGAADPPGLVLAHGFPSGPGGARAAVATFPELADRIANEMGWLVLAPAFRGCRPSKGDFSLRSWLDDVHACAAELRRRGTHGVWLAGFGTGGALSVVAGAADAAVRGVASLGAPADFDDWASSPRRLAQHARDLAILEADAAVDLDLWQRDLRAIQAAVASRELSPRPLLLVHGSEDDLVPPFDARLIADGHDDAELRMIPGAGHALRHDPRAVAILLGWLSRQSSLVG